MSDAQQTSTTPETQDSGLGPRRVVAFILSIILGTAVTAVAIITLMRTDLNASFPIAFINNVPLLPLGAIPMSLFFLIWIDFFMGTRILPD